GTGALHDWPERRRPHRPRHLRPLRFLRIERSDPQKILRSEITELQASVPRFGPDDAATLTSEEADRAIAFSVAAEGLLSA
ncbi:MAG: hypothetical protein ACJASK_002205, partial [Ilumatobacter sp.]